MIDKKAVIIRKRLGELERQIKKLERVVRELLYDKGNTIAVGKILKEQNKTLDKVIRCSDDPTFGDWGPL